MALSWDSNKTNYDYTRFTKDRVKLSANSIMPIYPNETLTVLRFNLQIEKGIAINLDDVMVNIFLLYPNGDDKMIGDLSNLTQQLLLLNAEVK